MGLLNQAGIGSGVVSRFSSNNSPRDCESGFGVNLVLPSAAIGNAAARRKSRIIGSGGGLSRRNYCCLYKWQLRPRAARTRVQRASKKQSP